ncbi:SWIM zinc finger family protein [Halosimplex aquaticum]|uniref:SWIM zinc finger family protein n=1 Tax=Halosimplex aquaticum TaxID=3026162 RepID=A0ABD5Y5K2_9EURY|nr:SWIM zinc finger family protein [Halosimplex aquaticum]
MSETNAPTPAQKTALAPDVRRLDERAARAWTERMAVRPLGDGRYAVDSQSGATYVVDLTERSCTCPDNQIRHNRCKHIRRVGIEITTRRVPAPGKRAASCDACGIETFVPEDDDEPHLCAACRLENGDVVRDREADDRLVVVRVTPERADEVLIEGVGETVADYPTNADYPADDLVAEVVYLSDLTRSASPRRYSFPLSRLERVDDAEIVDRDLREQVPAATQE